MTAGAHSWDCIIVGGGVIGWGIAWRLAQRGVASLVIDPEPPGSEASGAAAGILAPQIEAEGPGPLVDLGLASRRRYRAFAEELRDLTNIDIGYRGCGALMLAASLEQMQALAQRAAWQAAAGLAVEVADAAALHRVEPALGEPTIAHGGLVFPDEAQVVPARLVQALEVAARRAGAGSLRARVRRVLHEAGRARGVLVEEGELPAPRVVIAAGAWSCFIDGVPLPPGAVRPIRGQMVALGACPSPVTRVVFGAGGYMVPRAEAEVLVGATMEDVGFRKEVTAAALGALLDRAQRLVPALASAPVLRAWAGLRPATADHHPFLGPTHIEGLHLATGHLRNGILHAPITADAVAAAVCGEPPPVDLAPFSVARLPNTDSTRV